MGPVRYRQLRLSRTNDIRAVFQTGKRLKNAHLRLIFRPNNQTHARLCIQVSKKIARRAVDRNRIRRRALEAFREPLATCGQGVDAVLMPGRSIKELPWPELTRLSRRMVEQMST